MSSSKNSGLTRHQLKEMHEAFNLFDKDKSGSISASEMKAVFKSLGIDATDAEIKAVVKQMDVSGDGEISFDEFVSVMGGQFYRDYDQKEVKAAFDYFDKDHSGYISKSELKQALSKMGRHYTHQEIDAMFSAVDTDDDGQISLDEFEKLLR